MKNTTIINKVLSFYIEGFKNMKVGKSLWLLIAVKLFILFVVIKWLFFPNYLKENFTNDKQRSEYILQQLTKKDN
jgi:flagellar basal body-associated protein FliL